jgi:hypothetical protein
MPDQADRKAEITVRVIKRSATLWFTGEGSGGRRTGRLTAGAGDRRGVLAFLTAWMLPSRITPDLLAGIGPVVAQQLSAVQRRLAWDNEAGIGRGAVSLGWLRCCRCRRSRR